MSRTGECTDAVIDYVHNLHAAFVDAGTEVDSFPAERWRFDSQGHAHREWTDSHNMGSFARHYREANAEEYRSLEQQVAADADFDPLLGGSIGDEIFLRSLDLDSIVDYIARALFDNNGLIAFDLDAVRTKLAELREKVTATTWTATFVISLPGVTSDYFPVVVEDGFEIDRLTEDEVDALAQQGLLRPPHSLIRFIDTRDCIGARIVTPVEVHAQPPLDEKNSMSGSVSMSASMVTHQPEALPTPPRFGDRSAVWHASLAEDVLFALRLARSGFVSSSGAVWLHPDLFELSNTSIYIRPAGPPHADYELDQDTIDSLRDVWTKMRATSGEKNKEIPRIATRRFNVAFDRVSVDDAVVDYLIAAEALFLKDAGSADSRTELGFRLALRLAHLLEAVGRDRRATYKFVKRAYNLRSAIAHGGYAPSDLNLDGESVPFPQFVSDLGELMRDALHVALDELYAHRPFGTIDYWDDKLLGPADTPE